MDTPTTETNRDYWLSEARKVSRRVNFAWWLETLAAPLLIGSIVCAAAILIVRNRFPEISPEILAVSTGGGVLVLAIVCWIIAARRFEKSDQSLVRLEAKMELKNALSAAKAGAAPWPAPISNIQSGLRWHWPRLIIPAIGALAILSAGTFIPVSAEQAAPKNPEQPQAWKQLDASLEHLTKEQIVDEKYIEETQKKLEELRAQKEEQWFSHSSLEATDSLKKEHRSELDRMEREMERAEKSLEAMEKNPGANQDEKEKQLNEFQQALNGMQNGAMKPNPQLLEKMKQLGENGKTNPLSKEQMQQLRENLKKNAEAMKNGPGQNPGDDWSDELLGDQNGDKDGEGQGGKEGKDGEGKTGRGGVNRGPGHDPNVLGNEKEGVETGDLTGLESKDLSRALPGDLLQLQQGEHELDNSASQQSQGGDTSATGAGGDRIWKESLNPDEQRTLKKFFE